MDELGSIGNASLCAFSASSSRIRTLCFVRPITPFVKRFQPQTAIAAHTPARRPPQTRDRQSRSCAPSVIGRWSVNAIPIVRRRAGVRWRFGIDTDQPIRHRLAGHVACDRLAASERLWSERQPKMRKNAIDNFLSGNDRQRLENSSAFCARSHIEFEASLQHLSPRNMRRRRPPRRAITRG